MGLGWVLVAAIGIAILLLLPLLVFLAAPLLLLLPSFSSFFPLLSPSF